MDNNNKYHRIVLVSAFLAYYFLFTFGPFMFVHGTTTSLCDQTPYPELCNSFTVSTKSQKTLDKIPFITYRDSAILATLAQAEQAHRLFSVMDVSSFDPRAKSAWADCLELYEDSINLLNRSIGSNNQHNNLHDVQTWLSATLTNHETCKNGFTDFNLSFNNIEKSISALSDDVSKLISNSLAINKVVAASVLPSENLKGRRLLGHDDFPEWVSAADRKLLQAAPRADIVVAKDGSGHYTTISEAVGAAKSGTNRFVIYVKRGVYRENVEIKRSMKNIMMIGDGIDATIVTAGKSNVGGSTTFRSATFAATGAGFMARDMTFENTAGPSKHQAVALRSGSDFSVFYSCSFKGYQDTLYVYAQRQFYRDCDIYGTIDFIFGNAAAVLQNCNIYVRRPINEFTTVTAQGRTDPNQNTGIVIHNSRITAASDMRAVQGSYNSYLGRPWKQYSRTVVMKSSIDGLIDSAGWLAWSGNFALHTLYYGEYMNTGAGAGTGGRVKWAGYHVITSPAEAGKFVAGNLLGGTSWIAAKGVPCTTGL